MTNFSGKNLNAACGGPQGGGMDSRRTNQVAEVNAEYLAEAAKTAVPAGYKQTEVGVIPEDWQLSNIRDVSAIPMQNGLFYEPKRKGKGVPLINVGDMYTAAPVDVDSLELFNATAGEIKVFRVARGDLFFTRSSVVPSGIAYCNIFDSEREDVVFDSHLIRVRPNTEILEPRYLYLNCIAKHSRTALIAEAKTATMTTIDQGAINRCPVLVPPKKEQTAIANALSDVDALISELEKLIAKKQAIKTATMQQLLTGRTRLPQFALRDDGTPKGTKSSELGEIPEDWEVVAMGDLGSTYGGLSGKSKQDFGHGNSLYVPFTNVMANVVVDVDNLEKVDVREAQNNLALGDLLFNGSSETPEEVCFSALVSADIRKLYLNSFCFGFRSNQKNAYLPLYLAYWFRSEVGRAAVLVMAQGSTRYNISKSQFMKLTIVLPDTEEQTAIATILSDMDEEIQALEQRLSKTRQIKQGMMQELLTGKTRLVKPEQAA